ncbi:MAG: ribonuclease H-like domain-containing protein [Vicinamibacterales bacterium]
MTPPDLTSRLRAIVRPSRPSGTAPSGGRRELTYEPEDGRTYEANRDLDRLASALGGRWLTNDFGQCLVIDRRYESDRWHGDVRIGDCELDDLGSLRLLDPALQLDEPGTSQNDAEPDGTRTSPDPVEPGRTPPNPVFIDLETTGVSGGAGTVAFLVGCGYFDLGAFQIRQFLLTSYNAERALLAAVAELFGDADLIVTYNGKTFDVPVMETRWAFHRMRPPLDEVPHFDMLHPARRLWRSRSAAADEGGCRLTTLERALLNMRRVGDVDGFEIPGRFFQFLRTADPRPLEPVLEHNRLDLVSLAALTSHALRLTAGGESACRDGREALAVGRVLERAGRLERAEACYARAVEARCIETRAEALYRLGLRCRRDRRYGEAAARWRDLLALTDTAARRYDHVFGTLRQFALEALAIHHEHRSRDLDAARELALFALDGDDRSARAGGMRHRLARLDRKLARKQNAQLFS